MLKDPKQPPLADISRTLVKAHELGAGLTKEGPFGHYFGHYLIPLMHFSATYCKPMARYATSSIPITTFMNKLLGELIYKQKVVGEHLRKVKLRIPAEGAC